MALSPFLSSAIRGDANSGLVISCNTSLPPAPLRGRDLVIAPSLTVPLHPSNVSLRCGRNS